MYVLVYIGMSMGRSSQKNVAYVFVFNSKSVPRMFCWSYLDSLWEWKQAAVQVLFYRVVFWGFTQSSTYHSLESSIWLFLQAFWVQNSTLMNACPRDSILVPLKDKSAIIKNQCFRNV